MNNFMQYDFNISKIVLACYVGAGTANPIHKNRPSHGLAINKAGDKSYTFSDGKKLTVKENDIIYTLTSIRTQQKTPASPDKT